ncbi:carboxypeptidase-like regulatory domain-containing protein [Myroides indicus]|uniref:Carboxypeptidase family protein n=1 Tax=Myroides indicus TaxID=1323422 RepID=A0A4R7ESX7_9FLAO|nr:carboxypeptidase-like regulatory domain-containing protein [Myroides indicus]TDS56904.1 hypothetical protein C8P70_11853 [Myroides indicus]
MKTIIRKTIWLYFTVAVCTACDKSDSIPDSQINSLEKGYATGKVVDSNDTPISGAKILLDNTVFYASYIHGTTDKNGLYRIKVQPGSWRTFAYLDKTYNGQTYTMELFPDGTDSYTEEEGAIRNFKWMLEGRMPWESEAYYGGTVMLTTDIGFYENEENIELTLTPSGPLIDGSEGRVITLRFGDEKWINRSELWDIPIGRYKMTAKLKKNGKNISLRIEDWYKRNGLATDFQLDFIPKPANGVNNSASIVIGY